LHFTFKFILRSVYNGFNTHCNRMHF